MLGWAGGIGTWGLPEWATVIGFPVTVVAFAVALVQIARTRGAAEAAQAAIENTERHLADNHLLLLIPRLGQISRDLDHAVRAEERAAALGLLADWRDIAIQVRTLVHSKGEGPATLAERVDRAIALIPPAEDALNDSGVSPLDGTRHVRDRIKDAVDVAATIVTERMAFVTINRAQP